MKKNILLISLAALMIAPVLTSCKKGENDPAISLKSRKGRLTGEWELTEGTRTSTSGGSTDTYTYTSSLVTVSYGTGGTGSGAYSRTLTIEKDNTFEQVENVAGTITTTKGSWAWIKKNKEADLKNKEAISLFVTSTTQSGNGNSSTTTYTGINGGGIMIIDRLKNKELVITQDYGSSSNGSSSSTKSEYTFEKK